MGASERLFIALLPGSPQRAALAAWRDGYRWPGTALPVADAKLHLTLHFLGDVDSEQIAPLADALALPFAPFTLQLGQPALWPGGIAVLEPLAPPAALLALQQRIGSVLDELGIAREARPYRPHVTLARRAGSAQAPPAAPDIAWPVEHFALLASRGGDYVVLRSYRAG